MRNLLFLLVLIIAACGGSDGGSKATPEPVQHLPEISSLGISPNSADFMEGDGDVVVTAEITFSDAGGDVAAMWVRMPDGTRVRFDESVADDTGTFAEEFALPTNTPGTLQVEIWLVDKAGDSSAHRVVNFIVSDFVWTSRLSGLPQVLYDVVWTGEVFVAVGEQGAIFTSADGIDWAAVDSGTDANLSAVAADGPYVVAVGFKIILQSTDHGATWTVADTPEEAVLEAVTINASRVVVGGTRWGWVTAITLFSEDRGDTWRAADVWPDENLYMNGLAYRDGLYVASTNSLFRAGTWVTASLDGKVWNDIAVSDEDAVLHTIYHDGDQFILAGSSGAVFTSPDGYNWTQHHTPVPDVSYRDVASNGSRLVLAGVPMCGVLWFCESPGDAPMGLLSADGGTSWQVFDIDGNYESWGLAWGNGLFVSVGAASQFPEEGAIYTAE